MKKRDLRYLGLYIAAFAALGAMMPLVGQYLKSIGFSGTQIGYATAAGTATAMVGAPFWGRLYKGSKAKKNFIAKLALMAAINCLFLSLAHEYALFLALLCVMYFFQAPVMALIDAMTIGEGRIFGAVRKWGAVGFALSVFIAGKAAEAVGLHIIFYIYSGCFVVSAGMIFMMSAGKREADAPLAGENTGGSKKGVLRNGRFILLLISAFFINGPTMANNTYFGFLFMQGGGSIAGIGAAFLLMAGGEALFMGMEDRLAKMFSLEKTLLAAMCISALRFAWYASGPAAWLLLAAFPLQGMTAGIFLVEFVKYAAKATDAEDIGFAIPLYYAFGSSLSAIFCQMMSGIILDRCGAAWIYAFYAALNAIGIAVYLAGKLYKSGGFPAQMFKEGI